MSRALSRLAPALLLALPFFLSGCDTSVGQYYLGLKPGDAYILILLAAIVGMFFLFGTISYGKQQILEADLIKTKNFREAVHEAGDEIRLKRDALYLAQQELLGYYDRVLTEKQKNHPDLVARRRKLLDLERDILAAEGKRNLLLKQEPVA